MSYNPQNPEAFPGHRQHGGTGMTLRDYFAGQALAGLVAHTGSYGLNNGPGSIATRAYELADAMLKERTNDK